MKNVAEIKLGIFEHWGFLFQDLSVSWCFWYFNRSVEGLLLEIFQGKYFKVEIVVSYFLQIDYFNFSVLSEE